MKLNKINEVSMSEVNFQFVVIQKCCYHGNVT